MRFLKGVGPKRALDLARLGIETAEDLLLHFPREYLDLGEQVRIADLVPGQRVTVRGRILAGGERRPRGGMKILTLVLDDESGRVNLVFFNQPYLRRTLRNGEELIVFGEASLFRSGLQMISPQFEVLGTEPGLLERELLPLYPLTRGVGQRWLRNLMGRLLDEPELKGSLGEILPAKWREEESWPPRGDAIRELHFPSSRDSLAAARDSLKFEELFLLQLLGALGRHKRQSEKGYRFEKGSRYLAPLLEALPFELTGAQKSALGEIRADFSSGNCMNRLLQGDVGCGKTVVAIAALLLAVEGGTQGAFMAPLEVLARQHYQGWQERLEELGLTVALLTGGTPAKERRALLPALAAGEIDLIFGTHALIQEDVKFARLGLAVVDEQHRFGVRQRAAIREQGMPHVLVMSATPIPRSLAMTLYGDLDLSVIDELPPGRPALVTRLTQERTLPRVYAFLRERLEKGERGFLVFPLVEESDRQELKAATESFEALRAGEFAGLSCGLMHGRMSPARKAEAMEKFRSGEIRLLMATTVIEVGIDVPEATVMVIHNPERFGLSQLHQLRGRIGRGSDKSYCILAAPDGLGMDARRRLEIFSRHRDGFRLAEEDLKERGPGEVFGLRQHGRPELRLAHPLADARLVELARGRARALVASDPELVAQDLRPLRELLLRVYRDRLELASTG